MSCRVEQEDGNQNPCWKENKEPREALQNARGKKNRHTDCRFLRNRTRTGYPGFMFGHEVPPCRPEIRTALIRTTRIQNPMHTLNQNSAVAVIPRNQADPTSTETHVDQNKEAQTSSKLLDTGTTWSSDQGAAVQQVTRSRSKTKTETRPKSRRRKVQQFVFSSRGQLRLSITPEAGQLTIYIHEARGLMGKSCRSCDSYVKLGVTSDLCRSIRMKTGTVQNNKNPTYQQNFSLSVSEPLLHGRLVISVHRCLPDSRCSQLIGCMSFGIGSLIRSSQLITGWFYLLREEIGQSKHMRVTSQRNRPKKSHLVKLEQQGLEPKADLRRTPDSAPDTDLTWTGTMASTTRSISNTTTSCGPKETTRHSMVSGQIGSQELDQGNYSGCVSSGFCGPQHAAVSIIRGNDGFGFTIFADCPVRVQAVDPGGPAHQAGLCQGDSVLQLNGLPVETWKCADLAQAIRSCPSQVVLVVWRGLPELSSAHHTLLHPQVRNSITTNKLLPHPAHSKHSRRAAQGREHRSGLGVLGSLWRGRREDQVQEDNGGQEICSTIKGTRMTSTGDNYIILSPVNQGEQLPHPVYSGTNGTIGRLYQTHPSRTQSLLHNPRTWMSQQTTTSQTSTLPVLQPRTMVLGPPGNHGNYQNCTIVQSHLPRSSYGNYASLPPKTLIFPIFVQPLDLCSPDRTLCMAEEMILHKANLLPSKVTVLIYSDLLLLTREDDAGRCSVLQSPLYLKIVQFREVPSEPLHIYFLQKSDTCWCCLFSLEAFNIQQKLRVCLCLHSNIQSHIVTMETPLPYQFSDLPSDFDLLSLSQSSFPGGSSSPYSSFSDPCRPPSPYSSLSAPCRPPSPYSHQSHLPSSSMASPIGLPSPPLETVPSPPQYLSLSPSSFPPPMSPVWKQRDDTEEERVKRREEGEERQQGEGESSSETSESLGGFVGQGLLLSPQHINIYNEEDYSPEEENEEELICTPTVLRRSISEGSLLKEPRSPRFPSDSTIHRLTLASTFELSNTLVPSPFPNSPLTLKKQLTKEGGSLHQMLLLLNGSKDGTSRTYKLKKRKAKSLAADIQSRLVFLQKWKNYSGFCGNSLEKALRNNRPSETEVKRWAESLEALLANQYGVAVFHHFLRSEFSEENLDFWLAVEKFKKTHPFSKMAAQAKKIYDEFISSSAVRQVNVDSFVRDSTNHSFRCDLNPTSFQLAQDQIFSLMETDSYPRFLKSRIYAQLANLSTDTVLGLSNNSRSVS